MEKIKQRVFDLQQDNKENGVDVVYDGETVNDIKCDINLLLHKYLPEKTTIKQADILALAILDVVTNSDSYLTIKD